jgi:hypothetical protein
MAQLNQVGTQVKDEIDQVMAMIEAAAVPPPATPKAWPA